MKNIKFKIVVVLMTVANLIYAQPWSFNPNDFQFTMNISGEVSVSSQIIDQEQAYLGAFVNEECRGVSATTNVNGFFKLFQMTLYSNLSEGDTVYFKLMDENNQEIALENTIVFSNNAIYGSVDNPFVWMDVAVYGSADFLSFELDSQVTAATINAQNHQIDIMVTKNTDLSHLSPRFSISPSAKLTINDVLQVSGETFNDYSNTVYYTIEGIDGQVNDWAVIVSFENTGIETISEHQLNIYPNPAKTFVVINTDTYNWGKLDHHADPIEFYSLTGELIKTIPLNSSSSRIRIDLSELERGLYMVKLGQNVQKLIKE